MEAQEGDRPATAHQEADHREEVEDPRNGHESYATGTRTTRSRKAWDSVRRRMVTATDRPKILELPYVDVFQEEVLGGWYGASVFGMEAVRLRWCGGVVGAQPRSRY